MPIIRCIRHGESTTNAGAPAGDDPALTPLTPKGREQALEVSRSFAEAPELIVCSPFLRTQETAAPTQARFSEAPTEVWPVQEFNYLAHARCAGTTGDQRRPWVQAYWDAADPFAVDGPGAESFADLMSRVGAALERLSALAVASAAMFSHGQFLQALRWRIACQTSVIDSGAMRAFRTFSRAAPIGNADGFNVIWNGRAWSLG